MRGKPPHPRLFPQVGEEFFCEGFAVGGVGAGGQAGEGGGDQLRPAFGFVPENRILRVLFSPIVAWPVMIIGTWGVFLR